MFVRICLINTKSCWLQSAASEIEQVCRPGSASCSGSKLQSCSKHPVQWKINSPSPDPLSRLILIKLGCWRRLRGPLHRYGEAQIRSNPFLSHSYSAEGRDGEKWRKKINKTNKTTYTTSLEMIQETIALGRRQDALSAGRSFLQMTGASTGGGVWTHTGCNVMHAGRGWSSIDGTVALQRWTPRLHGSDGVLGVLGVLGLRLENKNNYENKVILLWIHSHLITTLFLYYFGQYSRNISTLFS